jgi:hypothetical protein
VLPVFGSTHRPATAGGGATPPRRYLSSLVIGGGRGAGQLTRSRTTAGATLPFASAPRLLNSDDDDDSSNNYSNNYNSSSSNSTARRGFKNWAQRRQVLRKRFTQQAGEQRTPSLAKASSLPTSYSEMDNASLVVLGSMGVHEAHKEILKRHIMTVDRCSYGEAQEQYAHISRANKEYMFVLALPYQIGIATAVTAGVISLPMVFHYGTAEWFNQHFVTSDMPEAKDLETLLEVGSWTWSWNEPVIGTLSFFLLTFQFSRAQLDNLGIKPYTHKVKQWRAERLAEKFPHYDINVIMNYSKSSTIHSSFKNYTY